MWQEVTLALGNGEGILTGIQTSKVLLDSEVLPEESRKASDAGYPESSHELTINVMRGGPIGQVEEVFSFFDKIFFGKASHDILEVVVVIVFVVLVFTSFDFKGIVEVSFL